MSASATRALAFAFALVAAPALAQPAFPAAPPSNAPTDYGTPISAAQAQALMPQPSGTAPANPAPAPLAGAATTFLRGDAVLPSLCRRTTVVTASDGSFSVAWATPLNSATPWAGVDPIWASTSLPPICWMQSISSGGVTGKCVQTQTTSLTTALVTLGMTVNPFGAGASGLTVKAHACEPTQ